MVDTTAADAIRQFEGYRDAPYWDRNTYRIGYGSDTWMDDQGNVHRVTQDTRITRQQAEADLARRIPEFQQQGVIPYVGADAWAALPPQTQAAVTSLAYNYGSLAHLPSLVRAIQSGDNAQVVQAIQNRSVDNNGINAARRRREADIAAGHPVPLADVLSGTAVGTQLDTTPPPPLPRPRPDTPVLPAAQGAAGGVRGSITPLPVTSGPTVSETKAEQSLARSLLPVAPPPVTNNLARTPIVPALNKSVQQIGQEANNARLNGYRDIQAMGPSSGPGTPVLPAAPAKSGAVRSQTVNVKADGREVPVQQAGSVGMGGRTTVLPSNVGGAVTRANMSGSPDDRQSTHVVSYEVANPAYARWLAQYGNGGANVSGSPDDRDERKIVPLAPPKTIVQTKTVPSGGAKRGGGRSTPVLPETVKGTATGNKYAVNSTVTTGDGRKMTVNKDGSFTNQATGKVSAGSSGKRYALLEEAGAY